MGVVWAEREGDRRGGGLFGRTSASEIFMGEEGGIIFLVGNHVQNFKVCMGSKPSLEKM